jgi:putative nucleotidyltransferase-like protein
LSARAGIDPIFARLAELLDGAPSLQDLEHHRLLLVAARRRREMGLDVPDRMIAAERMAAAAALAAPALLSRVRAAIDGPMLLLKGAEVARHYPDAALRSFGDVDLIVPDAERSQHQLLSAGFELYGEAWVYEGIHHLRPLRTPGLPLLVELHHEPKWVDGVTPPSVSELLELGVPAPHLCEDVLVLPAAPHVLLMAAHTWGHYPLTPVRDLLDIALVARGADLAEVDRLAADWGLERVWRTTWRATDCLFGDGPRPASMRIWARHLADVRERTVLESHLQRWLAGLWAAPGGQALANFRRAVANDLLPEGDEPWSAKLARTLRALRNAFVRKSHHDSALSAPSEGGQ